VAFSPDGAEAIVATGAGRAVILGAGGHRRRANRLGGRLRSVAVAGRTAFVADGRSGRIHRVRLGGML
jgi:cell division septation protein DedD